ncbi:CLPTM1L [Symbiodinium pilosum]|uniref:CLPTM1L protein n=1 Tax=Symbiodinium pilosum TaxID=2952 RepID=A0A812P495_SYMPI|nr:CLPTM1L [Symbiodinium pilosum]
MGTVYRIFQGLFAWYCLNLAIQLYSAFHAPRCPANLSQQRCYRPLYQRDELVDIHVFVTTTAGLQWWTDEGFKQLVPFFNTSVSYGGLQSPRISAILPLSRSELQGVRQNESVLHAHCFFVRSGVRLADEIRRLTFRELPGVISDNALHAAAQITKHLPQVQQHRRNLLAQQQDDSPTSERAVEVAMLAGWNMSIYPRSCMFWAGSLFVASHFFEPTLLLATLRHSLLVLMPLLFQQGRDSKAGSYGVPEVLQPSVPAEISPHLVPVFRLELAADFEVYDGRHPPPLLYKELIFERDVAGPRERDVRYTVLQPRQAEGPRYAPPFFVDTASFRSKDWRPLDSNASRPDPDVQVEVEFTGMFKYSMVQTFREGMKMYLRMGISERDLDDFKDMLFRQPLHILLAQQVIGFLQVTLRMLAFKNDITFFKGRSDYTGLSSRSLATDTLQEVVLFFYLYDFDGISRLLLWQFGMSAAISFWKYARVARLGTRWAYALPWAKYGRCASSTSSAECDQAGEAFTEDVDARGMRYLKYVLYPLSAAWGVYNLYHHSYKSWWSWMISSMADFAYTFGFVNMMPQIFINYKLKSVAHMPWRVLMYKFFNTFIDDIYAFVIAADQMTNKHRYMTLRDDVVFLIFLYQRHIYRVDLQRPDEFGNVYDDTFSAEKKDD